MNKLFVPALVASLGLAFFTVTPAHAGLDSCGNIDVEANAQCEVTGPEVSCAVACEPLEFKAACAAELEVSCEGTCEPPEVTVECTGSCTAECQVDCEASASFDCQASCEGSCDADCSGSCEAKCAGQAGGGSASGECEANCEASCQANCDAKCSASCEGQASASCEGKCGASCEGQCKAEADFDCQVDCQSEGYATCEAELRGGCEGKCEADGGFVAACEGEYLDHGGNFEDCMASLKAAVTVEINGYSEWESSASCENGSCQAEASGEAGATCSAAPSSAVNPFALGLGALALVGLRLRRRSPR